MVGRRLDVSLLFERIVMFQHMIVSLGALEHENFCILSGKGTEIQSLTLTTSCWWMQVLIIAVATVLKTDVMASGVVFPSSIKVVIYECSSCFGMSNAQNQFPVVVYYRCDCIGNKRSFFARTKLCHASVSQIQRLWDIRVHQGVSIDFAHDHLMNIIPVWWFVYWVHHPTLPQTR